MALMALILFLGNFWWAGVGQPALPGVAMLCRLARLLAGQKQAEPLMGANGANYANFIFGEFLVGGGWATRLTRRRDALSLGEAFSGPEAGL
jgi:hypothetical protein